jgi:hypothetical protein
VIVPILSRPRIGSERRIAHRTVSRQGFWDFIANGGVVDGTKSRDQGNTDDVALLRPGLLMGKVTTGGKWAPSAFGLTAAAYASGTSMTLSVAAATELNRRVGASGTFKVTGPPSAAGVVRTTTVTYSAVNTTTGVATITALGANQVEQINIAPASTAGNLQLTVQKTDGTFVTTGNAAWNATDATYLANINAALDTATGVVGGIVASAIPSVDTDLGIRLTYSGTGYAGLPWTRAQVAVFPTSSTAATYSPVTTAGSPAYVSGSLVQPTDGSETILSIIPDGYGIAIDSATNLDVEWAEVPIGGVIDFAQTLPLVSDASLKAYVKQALSTLVGGKFVFSDAY